MPIDLGHRFRDESLLDRALTHSSFVNEAQDGGRSNEVLEFLGDAVLDLVVADVLVQRLPDADEGTLTRLRATIVTDASLAQVAAGIGLGVHLRLGKGEEGQGGRDRPSLLAGAIEAAIGAAYLDGGIDAARAVVIRLLGPRIDLAAADAGPDPKSRIQEIVQATRRVTPTYRLLRALGPNHDPQFEIACMIGEEVCGVGAGRTKKEAAAAAAAAAIRTIEEDPPGTS
ncbi:MAG: ribonuclease III [Myxococcota bacterium]|nr:ribonuclease III [Myxococcota bacterium]